MHPLPHFNSSTWWHPREPITTPTPPPPPHPSKLSVTLFSLNYPTRLFPPFCQVVTKAQTRGCREVDAVTAANAAVHLCANDPHMQSVCGNRIAYDAPTRRASLMSREATGASPLFYFIYLTSFDSLKTTNDRFSLFQIKAELVSSKTIQYKLLQPHFV